MGFILIKNKPVSLEREKYKNAILYFIENCNNSYLGATKLNKLIYYLDFLNYRDRDESVTKDVYYNKTYGPVPNSIDEIMSELIKDRAIEVKKNPFEDKERSSYVSKKEPDISKFSDGEKKLLKDICKEFKSYETNKIVAQTHLEGPWFNSNPHEKIDYKYAYSIEVLNK